MILSKSHKAMEMSSFLNEIAIPVDDFEFLSIYDRLMLNICIEILIYVSNFCYSSVHCTYDLFLLYILYIYPAVVFSNYLHSILLYNT